MDTFNVPIYSASPEEVAVLVEKNGCFTIEFMELMDPTAWLKRPMDVEDVRQWIVCIKATMGSLFINHFGDHLLDDIFDRLTTKLVGLTEKVESSYREKVMLFFALKRKWIFIWQVFFLYVCVLFNGLIGLIRKRGQILGIQLCVSLIWNVCFSKYLHLV